ncbi:MAG: hypothetical protein JNN07_25995 [Verrucomicrobiales bacterium]|nr:hypothetical protein [Verrucomicrobiales bacterium]
MKPINPVPPPSKFASSLRLGLTFAITFSAMIGSVNALAAPRVLPVGELPQDHRLEPLKDLDGYFPFVPPSNLEAWQKRAERVRRQILVTMGLWPLPTKTPLNAVIHGRIERPDYTVEKVYFESMPGFFVTGNLYRPKGKSGKLPGILCPHGHWPGGRFYDNAKVREEIAVGAERFEEGGRSVLQARCVQLARMGCVVFHYDMLGYADSQQIPMSIAHGFSKQRPEMNAAGAWGLFSPAAESHYQNIMGLQTFNSIRSLDFLLELAEVDPARIGVTGASGGGTQTFILGAIDPRPAVAFPAVMVSTAMQGGCTCENACGLRLDTGNVEFAALFAPKPLGMTGADDWTKDMATKGFPELKQLYGLYQKPDLVHFKALNHFGHNYNSPSRTVMYSWLNKHLQLNALEPVLEQDYQRLTMEELSVWDSQHPRPAAGPDFERQLLQWWTKDARQQLEGMVGSPNQFRQTIRGALEVIIGRSLPSAGEVTYEQTLKQDQGNHWVMGGRLRQMARTEENPVVFLYPKEWNGRTVIWLHPQGKSGLFDAGAGEDYRLQPGVKRLIDGGVAVAGIDLLHQGEFLADNLPLTQTPRVKNNREAAAYTFGYNATVCAQRIQDVLRLVSFIQHHERTSKSIGLIGLKEAGHWAAAARALAGGIVTKSWIDTQGFRFENVAAIHDPDFLPGGAKYFDVPGMLALGAPGALRLSGETASGTELVQRLYTAAGAADRLTFVPTGDEAAGLDWMLQE